ncbi:MAG TPA: glycine zipper domain-containing protein [Chitinophagaceae bacterium]|nr:FUSC family protein [Chitinophagaceae bacterium]MCB9055636.1 FUSC family protein [Chitinophagales bacterium]HPG11348.1 glycine zipper domain-containing protein [Chitinophagaceae bacterium]
MARSHHRKKHKSHVRQFKHSYEATSEKIKKSKTYITFTVIGALLGFAIGYFASGNLILLVAGTVAGGLLGYFTGRRIDKESGK